MGEVKNNAPMLGAFGLPSAYEPVDVHLTTTNVPFRISYEYYYC
jgi:hypothetical protein